MKSNGNNVISCKLRELLSRFALKRLAKSLCRATEASDEAGDEILYGLPGVFTVELQAPGARVRLIKEARTLRIMDHSEKSSITMTIRFEDNAVVDDVDARECTMQKALAEGRMTFAGKTSYLAALLRANAAGDKFMLPNDEYRELYGNNEE